MNRTHENKNKNKKIKIAWFSLWPVYYHTPIYREIENIINFKYDFEVCFYENLGIRPMRDDGFAMKARSWGGIDLLNGYKYKFLKNSKKNSDGVGFFSLINISIIGYLFVNRPNIVVVQSYATASDWIAIIFSKIFNAKLVMRGEAILRNDRSNKGFRNLVKKCVLPLLYKNATRILYSCTGNYEYYKFYGVSNEKLVHFPCAVDNNKFSTFYENLKDNRLKLRADNNINENDFVVMFSGKFDGNKNPIKILKAIKSLEEQSKIVVLLVGDGPQRSEIENYAKLNKIRTVITGYLEQDQLQFSYILADVFILISNYDYSPKSLNEAMNFSLPIICSDNVGTVKDLVHTGYNGIRLENNSIDSISDGIRYIYNSVDRLKMGFNSRLIVNDWSFENDAKSFKNMIDDL